MNDKERRKRIARSAVDQWNEKHPIGTEVVAWRDNGEAFLTQTISKAEVSASDDAWIWVEGIAGAYDLEYVRPVTRAKNVK